ncbi:protein MIZU-KUSSEI 1 [Impatiens glandulifera]|uniref:protein MIZU-KUSSEI 1 n=1 Tax=Impatiens glandulifera TaxID=253017 RepID=UPI001FB1797F|nr:protein MIZU-KUSSEI 1 [Impatiens glandulifera]
MENPALLSLLGKQSKGSSRRRSSGGGGFLRLFKLFPMLTSGCKMVALLGRQRRPLLTDNATTGTLFGYKKGRLILAVQDDPHRLPIFIIELPLLTSTFHKEMDSDDIIRIALESETKSHKKKLMEEFVWAVYCNGRKIGYSIRRREMNDDELYVMQLLRGVSMGAGVVPCPPEKGQAPAPVDGELTYIRARFDRVIGSKDSEALYMINPHGPTGPDLSIFFLRPH